ncbi:MAG TPA: CRTAC1 family protein [Gemmataceae bacterium]|nr:CRTAC1 family protein [Gemmataceae bacterium]
MCILSQFKRPLVFLAAALVLLVASGVVVVVVRNRLGAEVHGAGGAEAPLGRPPGFEERAQESGITFRMNFLPGEQGEKFKANLYDHGCGVAVGDFDGDGYDDIFFCNQLGKCALYKNKGDGTFEDVTERAGVGLGDRICVAATWADYDNDGRQDLFVTSTRGGNVLFKNLGNGKFKEVTKEAGLLLEPARHSQTAVFFDYDNDGYLDLLVTNSARWTTDNYDPALRYYAGVNNLLEIARAPKEYNVLYRNNRDGTFTEVTEKAGLKGLGWGGDAAVFDYDGDGYLDVLITNMFGPSQLYRNNGNGTFTDVTKDTIHLSSWGTTGAKAFDFNNDGKLDLYLVDMHSDMWIPPSESPNVVVENRKFKSTKGPSFDRNIFARDREEAAGPFQIRYAQVLFGNTFFKNLGKGSFEEISDKAGMETFWPWGIATGDFDNDGFEDVFIPSGMGYPFFYWHNYLMMNNGNETFTNRAKVEGIEPPARGKFLEEKIGNQPAPRSSRAAAVADFNGDGRLDIIVNNFNDQPYYFKNNFPRKKYIAFKLQGTKSNRDAIGALVKLHIGKEVLTRQVNPAGGYLTQSSKTLHFGLGDRAKIDRVEIKWPRGRQQIIKDFKVNDLNNVVEPRD